MATTTPKLMAYSQIVTKLDTLLKPECELREYQFDGVLWLESRNGRGLLADEMGLGKTVQALAWLSIHPEFRPAVVTCPAGVKWGWNAEITKWFVDPGKVYVCQGKPKEGAVLPDADIYITNYHILSNSWNKDKERKWTGWVDYLAAKNPRAIVIDEVQSIKNTKSNRAKAVRKLCRRKQHRIALSGTPLENNAFEFWNCISLLAPDMFSYWQYIRRYCNPKFNGFGWEYKGITHGDELHEKLKDIMIRRKKADVVKELPPKTKTVVPIEVKKQKQYTSAVNGFLDWVKQNEGASGEALQSAYEPVSTMLWKGKRDSCIDWIRTFLESGEKLVVYAWNKVVITDLVDAFKKAAVKLDGSVSQAKRQEAVERFQDDKSVRQIVCNYRVITGMNGLQQAASNSCWVQLPWTPGELDQGDDRLHRLGQGSSTINCWYLVGLGDPVDEGLMDLLDEKRKVVQAILDGEEDNEAEMFMKWIAELKGMK